MLRRDGWAGLAILSASLLLLWATLGLKDNPLVPIGPGFYPRIVLGLTAVLAVWLTLGSALSAQRRAVPRSEPLNYGGVVMMFALFGLYCGALPYAGFRLATFAYITFTHAWLDAARTPRAWLRAGLVGLIATAAVYFVFERYLTVLLPRGRWTGF